MGLEGAEWGGGEGMTASTQCLWPKAGKGQPDSDQLDPPVHTHFHPSGTKMVPSTTRPGGSPVCGLLPTCGAEEPQDKIP